MVATDPPSLAEAHADIAWQPRLTYRRRFGAESPGAVPGPGQPEVTAALSDNAAPRLVRTAPSP